MKNDPLIITGMHRSGTSLIAKILHQCNIFMGARRDTHSEALYFKYKNMQMYRIAHADWDNPEPFKYLLADKTLCTELINAMKNEVESLGLLLNYWGLARPWKYQSPNTPNLFWGWKDPRNSYTLPIWLGIYPNAKVIHVYRNGIDIAKSLQYRAQHRTNKLNDELFSCRCLNLDHAFSLWVEYVDTCLDANNYVSPANILHLQYEDFLINPKSHMEKIAQFMGITWPEVMINTITKVIKPSRRYAFLQDPELKRLYEKQANHPLMIKFGYDNLE